MYPAGHARNTIADLPTLLAHKFKQLAGLGVSDPDALCQRLSNLSAKSAAEIRTLYSFPIDHVRPA